MRYLLFFFLFFLLGWPYRTTALIELPERNRPNPIYIPTLYACSKYWDGNNLTECGKQIDYALKLKNGQICAYVAGQECLRWFSSDELQCELFKMGYLK